MTTFSFGCILMVARFNFSEKVVFNISEKILMNSIKESWFTVKHFFMLGYSSANSGFIAAIITMPAKYSFKNEPNKNNFIDTSRS
jgi:hypothetical protein